MKPIHAVLLFAAIISCAVLSGIHNYGCAKDYIIADMNQALEQTLAEKREGWITPDTIADYRSHLKIAMLKESSLISYAVKSNDFNLKSKRMAWHSDKGKTLEFQSYANISIASVFAISDQRPATFLSVTAVLWAIFSILYFHRQHKGMVVIGGLMMDSVSRHFLTLSKDAVPLTPMQEQLLQMFFTADSHQLSKQQICDALWPKKPDASDTLYTLIRRIKPILADNRLTIKTSRGKAYQLFEV